jgi:hypothetical protein
VAFPELVHRCGSKPAVNRLNTHQLSLLSIEVCLEWPAVGGQHQQLRPGITWAQNDLVDATPGHRIRPQPVTDTKASRVCSDVTARESHHSENEQREHAEQG